MSDPASQPFRRTHGTAVWLATPIKSRWDFANCQRRLLGIDDGINTKACCLPLSSPAGTFEQAGYPVPHFF
ncbi:MAG: hypothetical protein IJT97_03835, partial [Bacteroidaceae bacterium]|nr:hypothetical protein [Bacteroidaceae bacterium]